MKYIALDKPYKVTSEVHGEVAIPENTLKVPQLELVEGGDPLKEVRDFVGSDQAICDAVNDVIKSDAKNGALAIIRNGAKDSVLSQLFDKAVSYANSFTWSSERGASKKKLLEGVEQIRAAKDTLKDMSQEQLLALLEQTLLR
jgi:hypothetical protein